MKTRRSSFADAYLTRALNNALAAFNHDWRERLEKARLKLVQDLHADIEEFPQELLENKELPRHRLVTRVFPLGKYQRTWLDDTSGHTVLYIGSNRHLYEYGPARTRSIKTISIGGNTMKLRRIDANKLEVHELLACRELLRQVWVL